MFPTEPAETTTRRSQSTPRWDDYAIFWASPCVALGCGLPARRHGGEDAYAAGSPGELVSVGTAPTGHACSRRSRGASATTTTRRSTRTGTSKRKHGLGFRFTFTSADKACFTHGVGSFTSALLLLLNMAGALLSPPVLPPSPSPSPSPRPASMGATTSSAISDSDDVDFFFFPFLVLYKSGRVHRFMGTDTVPASTDPTTGVASRDVVINATTGLAVRLYLPTTTNRTCDADAKLPLLVFYHGGAFVTESAFSPTYHRYLNALVSKSRVLAVSVEYHLAPERRLPTAYDDAWAALRWALLSSSSDGPPDPWLSRHADVTRLFLAGDSAGGNIAHNMALRLGREDLGSGVLRGLALLDPYFWGKRPVPRETTDEGTRRWRERTWSFVCGGRYGIDDPVINPVGMPREEWRRLPCARVLVTVAGLDVLRARGRAYVHALRDSGWQGEAEVYETPGEYHVYFLDKPESEAARKEMEVVVNFISGGGQVSNGAAASRMDA